MEVVNGAGTILPTSGGAGTIFQYTPGLSDNGVILLRYLPMSSTGVLGNITYVYAYVGAGGCPATSCNLVNDPGFESTAAGLGGSAGWGAGVPCWTYYNNSGGGMYSAGAGGSWNIPGGTFITSAHPEPSPTTVINSHFDWLVGAEYPQHRVRFFQDDAISQTLSTPLIAGNSYTVNLWAIEDNIYNAITVTFAGSNGPVVMPALVGAGTGSALPPGLTDLVDVPLIHDALWHKFTATFTPASNFSQLTIFETPFTPSPPVYWVGIVIGIDDISIVPTPSVCPFSLPDTICSSASSINLNLFTCALPRSFTWRTGSSAIVTHDTIFNPAAALQASIALGITGGTVYVAYDDTDATGCATHNVDEIAVDTLSLTGTISGPDSTCVGAMITLSGGISGGVWSSSNTNIAAVDFRVQ